MIIYICIYTGNQPPGTRAIVKSVQLDRESTNKQ